MNLIYTHEIKKLSIYYIYTFELIENLNEQLRNSRPFFPFI